MHRLVGLVVGVSVIVTGCGLSSVVPGSVDPACRAHADPADCQAALEVAIEGLGLDPDGYVIDVQPISCAEGECTTWVSAVPDTDDDCIPSYEAEVVRGVVGSWEVTMTSHGDPPCAFEP